MRYTDYKQVNQLAHAILSDDRKMYVLVNDLKCSLKQLKATFLDDAYEEVETYTNDLIKKLDAAQENFCVLAKELQAYADILKSVKTMESSDASGSGYQSPYQKNQFVGAVSYTNPQTRQKTTKLSNRTVYENKNIDPSLVIPAGTKYYNGRSVKSDTTNLALMEEGKSPFVPISNADGSTTLVPVELHHLTGQETQHGSGYFTGLEKDGTLVEIFAPTHDAYTKQLHIGEPSFRRDADGNKTEDAAKYEKFKSNYWKLRAAKIKGTQ